MLQAIALEAPTSFFFLLSYILLKPYTVETG